MSRVGLQDSASANWILSPSFQSNPFKSFWPSPPQPPAASRTPPGWDANRLSGGLDHISVTLNKPHSPAVNRFCQGLGAVGD